MSLSNKCSSTTFLSPHPTRLLATCPVAHGVWCSLATDCQGSDPSAVVTFTAVVANVRSFNPLFRPGLNPCPGAAEMLRLILLYHSRNSSSAILKCKFNLYVGSPRSHSSYFVTCVCVFCSYQNSGMPLRTTRPAFVPLFAAHAASSLCLWLTDE